MPDAPPLPAPPFLLRPYAAGDEGLYRALFTDAAVMHWVGPPLAEAHARRAADLALAHQQAAGGRFRHWIIEHGGCAAGLLGLALRGRGWRGGEGEVGVLLFPAWQGRGAASAAIGALRPWAFAAVGLAALTCHHAAGHAAMAALMRRLGFRPVPPRPDVAVPCGWECRAPEAMAAG
ncbi:MAG: hypothetical protein KatS3mg127_1145 [Silanimonas sp.]|jgi:RimJ/RimL family protein N-acetyltransferase|nr:MAG: hypothetical protein KatS3mg127_1145 [Silanimonas sp.]